MSGNIELRFVSCCSDHDVLARRLLASPCIAQRGVKLSVYFNADSAAEAFNVTAQSLLSPDCGDVWLIWVHEDVFLPGDWELNFKRQIGDALARWPALAVAGVYGVAGHGCNAKTAGSVLDRGRTLKPDTPLPSKVDSLDELLFAVRISSGLRLDPKLKFDFYATDVVLQAQSQGYDSVVVEAFCEHWSKTKSSGLQPPKLRQRIEASAHVFESKWETRLPITTSCFDIHQPGDVAAFLNSSNFAYE